MRRVELVRAASVPVVHERPRHLEHLPDLFLVPDDGLRVLFEERIRTGNAEVELHRRQEDALVLQNQIAAFIAQRGDVTLAAAFQDHPRRLHNITNLLRRLLHFAG